MNEQINDVGFTYHVDIVRDGEVIDCWDVDNIIPTEGINYLLGSSLAGSTAYPTWYLGLFEGNYTPVATDIAATFATLALESSAYALTTRTPWVPGGVSGGSVTNTLSVAAFTMNATKTIYGAFMVPVSAKNALSGVLLSAARFPSPKSVVANDIIQVTSGLTLVGA
jgi:hypothetical protein